MSKKSVFMVIALTLLALACKESTDGRLEKPNIILFLVDDLGWTDTGVYGSDLYETPNVDFLAENGVRFTDAYSACTVCSPTRASIMTGKYPARINLTDWITGHQKPFGKYLAPDWSMQLADNEITLAESLKSIGYKTIHLGKWHLGEEEKDWPENHGFDQNIGGWKVGSPAASRGGGYFSPYENPRLVDGEEGEYLTERLANEATKFIRQNEEEPFFMNFWLYNVHTPLQAKQDKIDKYQPIIDGDTTIHNNATYAAMVEHMDDALGMVIDQLKQSGLYENTILIFSSDNGGLIGKPQQPVTSNLPLRSGKGDVFEGGVRVPLIISWPNQITGGRTTDVLSVSADLYPTILGLIGKNDSAIQNENMDGEDLSNQLLENIAVNREAVFWHYPHYHTEGAVPYSAVRSGDWKLIQIYGSDTVQLFNLKNDIGEHVNKVLDFPEKANELVSMLNNWKENMEAQEPILNPDFDPVKQNVWHNRWTK